jgi:hypothetical protein
MVDSGGATIGWCPLVNGETHTHTQREREREREREKVIVYLQEKQEKVFAMIFFRNDDI